MEKLPSCIYLIVTTFLVVLGGTLFGQSTAASDSLLVNGDFENSYNGWEKCSGNEGSIDVVENAIAGQSAIRLNEGACLYQEFDAAKGHDYVLTCSAKSDGYATIVLTVQSNDYLSLNRQVVEVTSAKFESYITKLNSPSKTRRGVVTLYGESNAVFDGCKVISNAVVLDSAVTGFIAPKLLHNGGFEEEFANWNNCSGSKGIKKISADAAQGENALIIDSGGCIYQEFPVEKNISYRVNCRSKADGYSSISLTIMNPAYTSLESDVVEIKSKQYQMYSAGITAPDDGSIGAVTLYSEDNGAFDECVVSKG